MALRIWRKILPTSFGPLFRVLNRGQVPEPPSHVEIVKPETVDKGRKAE